MLSPAILKLGPAAPDDEVLPTSVSRTCAERRMLLDPRVTGLDFPKTKGVRELKQAKLYVEWTYEHGQVVQRGLRGVCIPRGIRIAQDEFYCKTTLYDSQASAALAQPTDAARFEPKEVLYVGNGKWINCCVALRHGCYTHLANIPDTVRGYSNARYKWSYRKGGWLCLSLWSTKAIKDEPVIVSSYGRQANKVVRQTAAMTSDWLVLTQESICSASDDDHEPEKWLELVAINSDDHEAEKWLELVARNS